MAFLLPLIGAAGSMLGGMFGNKQSQTSDANLTPMQKTLMNSILTGANNQLTNVPQDISGYFSNALMGNQQNQQAQQSALQRTLAARGLSSSPLATSSMANLSMQGANQNQQLINNMPLMRMQLLQNALSSSANAFKSTPFGQIQQQSSSMPFGGAIGSALNTFGGLGAMMNKSGSGNIFGNLFGGLFGGNKSSSGTGGGDYSDFGNMFNSQG